MRKCIRCNCNMIENYDVKVEGGAYGLKITKQGIFKITLARSMLLYVLNVGILNSILKIPKR